MNNLEKVQQEQARMIRNNAQENKKLLQDMQKQKVVDIAWVGKEINDNMVTTMTLLITDLMKRSK